MAMPSRSRLLLASAMVLLFIPPFYSALVFFWPLLLSTAMAVLAVVSFVQHDGIAGQDDQTSDCPISESDLVAVATENVSDVLMVGDREVTWLEWLHNEDMKKCRAQELVKCIPADWNLEDVDVAASDASVGILSQRRA